MQKMNKQCSKVILSQDLVIITLSDIYLCYFSISIMYVSNLSVCVHAGLRV